MQESEKAPLVVSDVPNWFGLKFNDLDCVHWIEESLDAPGPGNRQDERAPNDSE